MIFNYFLLPMFFFVGLAVTYEDFRYGKIRNRWILLGVVWALSVYFLFFLWDLIGPSLTHFYYTHFLHLGQDAPMPIFSIPPIFFLKVLMNSLIAFVVAFLMWRAKSWSAGDAKLFFVFSLLIPTTHYWKSYLPFFPSLALLVNIFIPLLLFLFLKSVIHFFKFSFLNFRNFRISWLPETVKGTLKNKNALKTKGIMILAFLTIFLFLGLFQKEAQNYLSLDIKSLIMVFFPLLVILSGPIAVLFQKPTAIKVIIFIFIFLLGYGLFSIQYRALEILWQSLQTMIVFMIAYTLFVKLINFYIEESEKGVESHYFPLAVWLFIGGLITLIFKESILLVIFNTLFQ